MMNLTHKIGKGLIGKFDDTGEYLIGILDKFYYITQENI
jgi:hypothetical protein